MSNEQDLVSTPKASGSKKRERTSRKGTDLGLQGRKKRKRRTEESDGVRSASKKHRGVDDSQSQLYDPNKPSLLPDFPFQKQTASLYVPLSPISQFHPLEGLCAEHISPLLLTYYRPFAGVILSYANVKLSDDPNTEADGQNGPVLAKAIDEYGGNFVWITADFLLLKPRRGQWIEGWINLQNESHIGVVCWNLFNASIEQQKLPQDWTWRGVGGRMPNGHHAKDKHTRELDASYEDRGQGCFVDGSGGKIEGLIRFRVRDIETAFTLDRGFMTLEGTMLDEEAEKGLVESEQSISRGANSSIV